VVAASPNDDWDWEELFELEGLDCYLAEAAGRPVGMVQILDTERDASRYWGETGPGFRAIDIWIGPADALGKGFGTVMMEEALARCFADPSVHTVLIDPLVTNDRAIRFYRRVGFTFLENRRFGDDDCAVHLVTRDTFENRTSP